MIYVLAGLDAVVGIALLVLIFLHSGKDAGLSSAFGGSGGTFGGSGVVQKNLDRLTVVFAVAFMVITIVLGFTL